MSISDVRSALATAVDGIANVRARAYPADQVNPPEAFVVFRGIEYDIAMGRGADQYNYAVQYIVARDAERQAQTLLDTLCEPSGATSLKTVVEADTTLNTLPASASPVADYSRVRSVSGVQVATIGATEYLMIEFEVEVVY